MVTQQIVDAPARATIFLTVVVDDAEAARGLLADLSGLTRSVAFRAPYDDVGCIAGIGASLWDRLFGADTRPAGLHEFAEIRGDRHVAPSTGGDLHFHLRAGHLDLCFELASLIVARLGSAARVVDEVHGFKFFDERDLLGFVDGTENPEGAVAVAAVTIGDDDPYAGGSYVIVQKYTHDMAGWRALTVEQQADVIGRSKLEDVEMADDVKPKNSHVALNVIHDSDGTQLQIVRENMPFGAVGEGVFGTYFIGYAKDSAVTERMLRNMFVGDPPGNTDRLLDFSAAHTGALFFVPSAAFLDDPTPVTTEVHP